MVGNASHLLLATILRTEHPAPSAAYTEAEPFSVSKGTNPGVGYATVVASAPIASPTHDLSPIPGWIACLWPARRSRTLHRHSRGLAENSTTHKARHRTSKSSLARSHGNPEAPPENLKTSPPLHLRNSRRPLSNRLATPLYSRANISPDRTRIIPTPSHPGPRTRPQPTSRLPDKPPANAIETLLFYHSRRLVGKPPNPPGTRTLL